MKASVRLNGSVLEVLITFRNGYAGDVIWTFTSDCGQICYAGLAAEALSHQFHSQIEHIRREAYELGWGDAKKRNEKRKYFSSAFNIP